jgi:outer membrane protein OmpA-like peptidoglycan-associated protein
MKNAFLLFSASVVLLMGCSSMSKQGKGTAIGAGAGAALGALLFKNDVAGALIGAAVGGAAGNLIGKKMDKQAQELKQAIPSASVERVGEGINVTFDSELLFEKGKSVVSAEGREMIAKTAKVLVSYPDQYVLVEGHTSSDPALSGEAHAQANLKLSEDRANAVVDIMENAGIARKHLIPKWYGGSRPKFSNETEDSRAKNRRVELGVIANEEGRAKAEVEAKQ